MTVGRRVEVGSLDTLVYKGQEIDLGVLEAIVDTNNRLLWAFMKDRKGDVRAVSYTEADVIWLTENDV